MFLLLAVSLVVVFATVAVADIGDVYLAKMKVTREIIMGSIVEYEVQVANKGPAIFKNPPFRLKIGEELNMFVQEGVSEKGRPAIVALQDVWSRSFVDGFARIAINDKWTFMDKNGRLLGKYLFKSASDFHEGLATCESKQGTVILDTKGEILNTPAVKAWIEYSILKDNSFHSGFSEGFALMEASTKSGSYVTVLLDRTGAVIKRLPDINLSGKFSEGLAPVNVNCERWGYANTRGEIAIPPLFNFARVFKEGRAAVCAEGSGGRDKWGFIDSNGKYIVEPTYDYANDFSEGMAAVKSEGRWGYVDKDGNLAINAIFDETLPFSDGLAAVQRGGAWGYINKTGEVVISYVFKDAKNFAGGLAPVAVKERYFDNWGYINKAGKFVIPPKYAWAEAFSDGVALVRESYPREPRDRFPYKRYKYITPTGQALLWFTVR